MFSKLAFISNESDVLSSTCLRDPVSGSAVLEPAERREVLFTPSPPASVIATAIFWQAPKAFDELGGRTQQSPG